MYFLNLREIQDAEGTILSRNELSNTERVDMEHILRIGEKRLTRIILDYSGGGVGGVEDTSTRRPEGRWKNEVIAKEKTRYEETKGRTDRWIY